VDYSEQVLKEFKGALGEVLYELVTATNVNIDTVAESILNSLRKIFSDSFPHGEMYFSLLTAKLKQGMIKAYGECQKKVEDERNRLII